MHSNPYHTDSHRMGRRSYCNDYHLPGVYHVTITVNDRRQQPLGRIVGDVSKPDGDPDAPHVELSPIGQMVREELLHSITAHYPMVEVQDYVIMPDHLHCMIVVKNSIISKNGRLTHLGQLISGFKKGCARRYWEMTGQPGPQGQPRNQEGQRGNPAAAIAAPSAAIAAPAAAIAAPSAAIPAAPSAAAPDEGAELRHAGCPQAYIKIPSNTTTGRQPLFSDGYVDVMPLEEGQIETQRVYIRNNPRYRLMRSQHRSSLIVQRGGIDTALSLSALKGYLQRECRSAFDDATWTMVSQRLLMRDSYIDGDSYGNRQLLTRQLFPVVCHRKDIHYFSQQKDVCLRMASQGAVLVSARIAKGEQEIMDAAIDGGFPVVLINDQGMPELYHPSESHIDLCLENRLLIVTPWTYRYRMKDEMISVGECKTMNCIAQALCRKKDNWWKES